MLTEEQLTRLRGYAAEERTSVAEIVRRLVDAAWSDREGTRTEDRRRGAIAAIGIGRSGVSDLAEKHDDYLVEAYS